MATLSKRLVIDASVARSAGGPEASVPESARCRDLLMAVKRICHRLVYTRVIAEEWRRHRSAFSQQWLLSMFAHRKVVRDDVPLDRRLRSRVRAAFSTTTDADAAEKDCHLIEAALAFDQVVLSRDDTARLLFEAIAASVGEIRHLAWVNPSAQSENAIEWLEDGAPAEGLRCLGRNTVGN